MSAENKIKTIDEISAENQMKTIDEMEAKVIDQVSNIAIKKDLVFPKGYDPQKSMINAFLEIKQNPELQKCSQISIAQSLLQMVTMGLDISQKQAYLIPFSGAAKLNISYFGQQTLLRRIEGVKDIIAQTIYEGDELDYNVENGNVCNLKHKTLFANRDKKIIGAYAVIKLDEKTFGRSNHIEIMTKGEIEKSWGMGAMNGKSKAHNNFPQEMSKKTVINRAVKNFINTITENPELVKTFNDITGDEYERIKTTTEKPKEQDLTIKEPIQEDNINNLDWALE